MGVSQHNLKNKKKFNRSSTLSRNLYFGMVIKIYRFLTRRTNSKFNYTILKRLQMSKKNQAVISLSRLIRLALKSVSKVIVIVGKVLNDDRLIEIPKLSICALEVTNSAKKRIIAAGGSIITFDQLASENPKGKNTILIRGPRYQKKINKFFD
nr:60S ribosomal protein L18 [Cryptomonas curvata]